MTQVPRDTGPAGSSKGGPQRVELAQIDLRFESLRLVSPVQMRRLRVSVERDGIRHSVLVSTGVERDRMVLVDGFKRTRVALELGFVSVWAQVVALDAAQSKASILQCNIAHPGLSGVEEAWIVRSLCREHGLTQSAVGKLLGRDKSWVCRRLKLAEHLDEALQDDLRLGLLDTSSARELSRLPRGNQVRAAGAVRDHGLSTRQTSRLVGLLLDTDNPSARRQVLQDPLRYVTGDRGMRGSGNGIDPRLSEGGNELRRSLLVWEGVSTRLVRGLRHHAPAGLQGEDAQGLASLMRQAAGAGRRACDQVEQCQSDSGLVVQPGVGHASGTETAPGVRGGSA